MRDTTLEFGDSRVVLRDARESDLGHIVALLAADQLGSTREAGDDLAPYRKALAAIDSDPAQTLVVGATGDEVVATMQLSFIPGLARSGALRAQIEAVRVRDTHRGVGLGGAMLQWAIEESRARGCALVQLTSDTQRSDALRFYERLGFEASHHGLKLAL